MPTKQWREENRERLREYARRYYLKNKERLKAQVLDRLHNMTSEQKERERVLGQKWQQKNADRLRKAALKRYYDNREELLVERKKYREKNREAVREYNRDYRRTHRRYANQFMKDAHTAAVEAIRVGVLVPATKCERCGKSAKKNGRRLDAHHWHGYAKENHLDVEWLCIACHAVERRKYV